MSSFSADAMAILESEEVMGSWKEAQERANPVPHNGLYNMLLTKVGEPKKIESKATGKTFRLVPLSLKVVDPGEYGDYPFTNDFFISSPSGAEQFLTFTCLAAGKPIDHPVEGVEALQAVEGSAIFEVEISRSKGKDGREYVNMRAKSRSDVQE